MYVGSSLPRLGTSCVPEGSCAQQGRRRDFADHENRGASYAQHTRNDTGRSMSAPQEDRKGWTIEDAERLLMSLKGVVSARLVTRPGGEVEEIHLLTTEEVSAKQTVRNVESALLAHLDLGVDHRKISVAQTKERPAPPAPPAMPGKDAPTASEPLVRLLTEPPLSQNRLLFGGHQVETERSHQVRHRVDIEWRGTRHTGMASAADLPRPRMEAAGGWRSRCPCGAGRSSFHPAAAGAGSLRGNSG